MMFLMPLGNHYDDHDANNELEDYCDEEQGKYSILLLTRRHIISKKKAQQEVPC